MLLLICNVNQILISERGGENVKRLLVVLSSLLLILTLTIPVFAHEKSPPNSSGSDTYFIAFKSKSDQNEIKNLGGEIKRQYKYIPVIAARLPEKAVTALSKNPNIDYIEQDTEAYAIGQVIPWGIPHVNAT